MYLCRSEVQVNYWYAVDEARQKVGAKSNEDLFFMNRAQPYEHPIWPKNQTGVQAVTFISNCNAWQRNLYVQQLQDLGLRIDHFGGCSFGKERKTGSQSKEVLQAGYPFILAFENSLLDDYVTEKYFQGLMNDKSIMVYMGSRNLNESLYAPVRDKRYFIHALDYTPQELFMHLTNLLADSSRFEEYLQWHLEPKLQPGFGVELASQNFVNVTGWICRTCMFAREHGIVT